MEKPGISFGGVIFLELLTIVFVACKLTGVISWSWWWVLAPLWVPIVLVIAFVIVLMVISAILCNRNPWIP